MVAQSTNQPTKQASRQSTTNGTNQPTNQATNQPTNQSISQSINQSIDRRSSPSFDQPIDQPAFNQAQEQEIPIIYNLRCLHNHNTLICRLATSYMRFRAQSVKYCRPGPFPTLNLGRWVVDVVRNIYYHSFFDTVCSTTLAFCGSPCCSVCYHSKHHGKSCCAPSHCAAKPCMANVD